MYCLNLLGMALELAIEDPVYEDVASKFWEHFVYIAHAMHHVGRGRLQPLGRAGRVLLRRDPPAGRHATMPIRVRSLVGLIPLSAVVTGELEAARPVSGLQAAHGVVLENRQDLTRVVRLDDAARRDSERILFVARHGPSSCAASSQYMLDENEFLSPYGIRSVSRYHRDHPYAVNARGPDYHLDYEPGESTHAALRRQLELAGPDLVSDQLPDPRVAQALPPVLRRRLPGRVPDGLGQDDELCSRCSASSRGGSRAIFLPDARGRAARSSAASRSTGATRTGRTSSSSTSTSTATRERPRRDPPDGLDGPRRQAPRRIGLIRGRS